MSYPLDRDKRKKGNVVPDPTTPQLLYTVHPAVPRPYRATQGEETNVTSRELEAVDGQAVLRFVN